MWILCLNGFDQYGDRHASYIYTYHFPDTGLVFNTEVQLKSQFFNNWNIL
jgi:hypothetical protein